MDFTSLEGMERFETLRCGYYLTESTVETLSSDHKGFVYSTPRSSLYALPTLDLKVSREEDEEIKLRLGSHWIYTSTFPEEIQAQLKENKISLFQCQHHYYILRETRDQFMPYILIKIEGV